MHGRMQSLMDAEGLPYGRRTHTYNSRLAQELAKWADSKPGAEALHQALYRAYFAGGRNIGDPEALIEIAGSAGLPQDEARDVIQHRRFKDAVDADWEFARRSRVTAVPTFIAGTYRVVGAQPYDALAELVKLSSAEEQRE